MGEINTEPARPAPIAARPNAPAPLAALPGAIPDVVIPAGPANTWTLAALAALLVLVLLAAVLNLEGAAYRQRALGTFEQ